MPTIRNVTIARLYFILQGFVGLKYTGMIPLRQAKAFITSSTRLRASRISGSRPELRW